MSKTPTGIIKIREVIKDIVFDFKSEKVPKIVLKRIVSYMETVEDERSKNMIKYPLSYILLLSFLAILSGAESWCDMESFAISYKIKLNGILPNYKKLKVPSHDTFRRIFGILNPESLQKATTMFLVQEIKQLKEILGVEDEGLNHISIDGKEQRGTGRKYNTDEKIPNLQTLHCYDVTNGICLASIPINSKTNEIPVAQQFLKTMELKNCVVTFDAMNTQKNTINIVNDKNGHYVGGLKGNQQLFHNEVELFFSEEEMLEIKGKGVNYRTYTEKAHNKIEKRSYYMTTDINWFEDLTNWKGLKAFVCYEIETKSLVSGKETKEKRYYITSLKDIELCSDAIRSHWGIENQLHWHLDVTFSEDDNTTIDKNAFNNLSILNKMALSLLKLVQPAYKIGLKGIRKKFGWNLIKELTLLLSLLDENEIAQALQSVQLKSK